MKRKLIMAFTAAMLMLGLASCGENQIPEMTDAEMQMIGEYTAIILMKYDVSNRSRLVDVSLVEQYEQQLEAAGASSTPEPEQKPAGMDPVDDTPVINSGTGTVESTPSTMEEVLGLPEGMSILYLEQALYDSYPDDESNFFALTATEGKKLLVLNFSIINASGQEQTVDFLSMAPEFRITVNGDYTRRALMTMLENDLSTYMGTIPASEGVSTVLVIEVEDEDAQNLSSISLNLKNGSETYTIQLL